MYDILNISVKEREIYMKTLTTDNKFINGSKPVIQADITTIESYAKHTLKWRTSKQYSSIYKRLMNTSSSNYDKVICALYFDGYGIKI